VLNVIQERAVKYPDRLSDLTTHFYDALDELMVKELGDPRTFVEVGKAHDRILQHSRDRSIDILVLGICKPSHLGMEMRTSGAFRLIVDAECPVLTIQHRVEQKLVRHLAEAAVYGDEAERDHLAPPDGHFSDRRRVVQVLPSQNPPAKQGVIVRIVGDGLRLAGNFERRAGFKEKSGQWVAIQRQRGCSCLRSPRG